MYSEERLKITRELEILLADYWHDVDTNWGRNAGQYYTEDAVFEAEHSYRGRAKIEEFYRYRESRGARVAVHAITNFRAVPQTPTTAVSTWYMFLYANDGAPILPSAPPNQISLMTDQCVKGDDGRWRYKHRKFEVLYKGGAPVTNPNLG